MEYGGDGVKTLTVPERATITNMGAELGATTSIFPSDEVTRAFLKAQGRERGLDVPLAADPDAVYDEVHRDRPRPRSSRWPPARTARTTSSRCASIAADQGGPGVHRLAAPTPRYADLMTVAAMLKGKTVAPGREPRHRARAPSQVLTMLARERRAGRPASHAGARMLECACGPCIGMGQSPQLRRRLAAHVQPQL